MDFNPDTSSPTTVVSLDTSLTSYKIPISAIALWPAPNFENPVRRHWLNPIAFCLFLFTTLVLGARLWARITRQAGAFGGDDVFIIFAWIAGALFTALALYAITWGGFDRHVWDIPSNQAVSTGFVAWSAEALFLTSTCLTKVSILLFYRRIMERSYSRTIQWAIYVAIASTVIYFFAFFTILVFACTPVDSAWKSMNLLYRKPYHCVNRREMDALAGVFSVVSDAYALAIPQIVISKLQMQRKQKVVLYCIFSSGLIVVAAGIARTYWMVQLHYSAQRDLTWVGFYMLTYGFIEMCFSIICASIPALKGFFSIFYKEPYSKSSKQTQSRKYDLERRRKAET
ncbi:hypothetical protein EJ08DRAFT_44725 [Tothia fuscella]|uniref:Rhodopsin domain-containing protein n=1 Tax=Tothia fuscella TaxID=1048955 RepID=A0A9P4TT48_9PEZI|nr:hypothetical protein EJ08DRAFT_44725 [Tothia fuscella]